MSRALERVAGNLRPTLALSLPYWVRFSPSLLTMRPTASSCLAGPHSPWGARGVPTGRAVETPAQEMLVGELGWIWGSLSPHL